jgi:hypothetical protein
MVAAADGRGGANKPALLLFRQTREQIADHRLRSVIELGKGGATLCCQLQRACTAIARRQGAADQAAPLEPAQDPAQISAIHTQLLAELGRGWPLAKGNFIEDTRLGQRKRALQKPVLEHSDFLGVEAIEPAQRGHSLIKGSLRHSSRPTCFSQDAGIVSKLVDGVN